jgi:undecaprenyl-diphosphatase
MSLLLTLATATKPGEPIDGELYRSIAGAADQSPGYVHFFALVGTQLGLFAILALFAVAWWHSRRGSAHAMAMTLLGVVSVGVAYVLSTVLKDIVQEVRPCRALAPVATIDTCPAPTDWSFPSNHAVLATVAAVALVLVWRRLAWVAVPLALLVAASRVFIGVHYPHDVLAGMLLGGAVGFALPYGLARWVTPLVHRLRDHPIFARVLGNPELAVAGSVHPKRIESTTNSGTYQSEFARW